MAANPVLGIGLHAVGGLAAASFYIPFKRVRHWAWESYWLVGGFFSWIIAPWVVALATCPDVVGVLRDAPAASVLGCYGLGVLWGIGGLTFGLSMRYLGMSLGYALALGFCAACGTIVPPLILGGAAELVGGRPGQVAMVGVGVCLAGIAICGCAGMRKEREVSAAQKAEAVGEFNFVKGVWVAVFAGVMSACMALAFAAGKPIAAVAVAKGTPDLFKNYPVLVATLAGGFTTNAVWCVALNLRNRTGRDYVSGGGATLAVNYLFAALAGITWYLQFFFYGMGTTRMGRYEFSSWAIHMAFIIVFSTLWGLYFREWRGSSRRTHHLVVAGIVVLLASIAVVGVGDYLKAH
ncbi:MAG: L-rhamnose/proton symporter RhaT [Candidatus Hydrogenedentes bacterium]|nr:L-rhamnose/proton symporter RhaT [Candidatus Hydrogenedentota bacterium]